MSWDRPFDQPLPLPNGAPARTLREASNYIKRLPKSQRDRPEWRLAIKMLIEAADDRGPILFAKIGMVQALSRTIKPVFGGGANDKHRGGTHPPLRASAPCLGRGKSVKVRWTESRRKARLI